MPGPDDRNAASQRLSPHQAERRLRELGVKKEVCGIVIERSSVVKAPDEKDLPSMSAPGKEESS